MVQGGETFGCRGHSGIIGWTHRATALGQEPGDEDALQVALHVVQSDAGSLREKARKTMIDIFHLLPDDSDLARQYRRQLSMALY